MSLVVCTLKYKMFARVCSYNMDSICIDECRHQDTRKFYSFLFFFFLKIIAVIVLMPCPYNGVKILHTFYEILFAFDFHKVCVYVWVYCSRKNL